jgi:hypothetical protein
MADAGQVVCPFREGLHPAARNKKKSIIKRTLSITPFLTKIVITTGDPFYKHFVVVAYGCNKNRPACCYPVTI